MHGLKYWCVPRRPETGDFRVRGIGQHEVMPAVIVNRPDGTADYLFAYFYSPIQLLERDEVHASPSARLVLWEPRRTHYYGRTDTEWSHSWLHCDGAFVDEALRRSGLELNVSIPLADPLPFEEALSAIHAEVSGQAHPDAGILKNTFESLLRRVVRALQADTDRPSIPDAYLEIKHHMEVHYLEKLCLKDLAQRLNVSAPYFCSQFKRHFGTSPIDFVIDLRMHDALQHLRNVNHNISDVARSSGYDDIFYFSKIFKRRFGLSPSAMRARMLARAAERASGQDVEL